MSEEQREQEQVKEDKEYSIELAQHHAEWLAIRHKQIAKETALAKKFELLDRLDSIDDGWYLFSCLRNNDDGTQTEGSIQATGDREMVAWDTFEAD